MTGKPKVGDRVRFNDEGLEVVFGSTVGLAHMRSKILTLTRVDDESLTNDVETYIVEVDDPEIDQYLLASYMFDLVTE